MLNDRSDSPAQGAAPSPLQTLRQEIDRLDDSILELIERRLAASAAVAASKDAEGGAMLKLRHGFLYATLCHDLILLQFPELVGDLASAQM